MMYSRFVKISYCVLHISVTFKRMLLTDIYCEIICSGGLLLSECSYEDYVIIISQRQIWVKYIYMISGLLNLELNFYWCKILRITNANRYAACGFIFVVTHLKLINVSHPPRSWCVCVFFFKSHFYFFAFYFLFMIYFLFSRRSFNFSGTN